MFPRVPRTTEHAQAARSRALSHSPPTDLLVEHSRTICDDEPPMREDDLVADRSLLVVDRDALSQRRVACAMRTHGFDVTCVETAWDAFDHVRKAPPAYAVVELRPEKWGGIELVAELRRLRPTARAIVCSAFDNLTTAVLAIRAGACDYLAKPVDERHLYRILSAPSRPAALNPPDTMSIHRVKWERIHRVYELCDRNVSDTARRLRMSRRSVQRMLYKRSPK